MTPRKAVAIAIIGGFRNLRSMQLKSLPLVVFDAFEATRI
jgi:hypothetical protein